MSVLPDYLPGPVAAWNIQLAAVLSPASAPGIFPGALALRLAMERP